MILAPYVLLKNRHFDDRLGANILSYMCQIIIAHYYQYYIDASDILYEDSIFIKTIIQYINFYNTDKIKIKRNIVSLPFATYELHLTAVQLIQCDIFTYFNKHMKIKFIEFFQTYQNYILSYDPKNTILVHLRLDDLDGDSYYDGKQNNIFMNNIVNNIEPTSIINESILRDDYNIFVNENSEQICLNKICRTDFFFGQSAIQETIIDDTINKLKEKYSNDNIVIISSTVGDISLNYNAIRSQDPDKDLYYLCNCDKLILSRSTYALSSLFFNSSNNLDVYIPYFNIATSLGLTTKFDLTQFTYYN